MPDIKASCPARGRDRERRTKPAISARNRRLAARAGPSAGAAIRSRSPARSSAGGVARSASSPVNVADGTRDAGDFPAAAVVIPTNASCALSAGFEGPTSLRMAFSLTPSRCAIARLLIPWLFASQCRADVSRRCVVDRDANPLLDRAPPSHPAHSAFDTAARCAPIGQTPAPRPFAGQSPTPPRTPSHRPRRPHPRHNSDAPAVQRR